MSISETIQSDLKNALLAGQPLPCALTLKALSEHYQVSAMPVRQAVEALLAEGLLQRGSNGRLEAPNAKPSSGKQNRGGKKNPAINKRAKQQLKENPAVSAQEATEAAIRNNVIQHCLNQQSDYLREAATAEAFGIGRTVVRQLFARLAGEGLLEHVPRCGWRVRLFSEAEMLEYLAVRELLELKALDLARPHFNTEELQQLLAANQPAKPKKPARLDLDLHQYWIERCGNYYIQDFFSRYAGFYNALFNYAVVDSEVKTAMATEHRDIIHCLLKEDWRGARKALQTHIRDQRDAVSQLIRGS